MVHCQGANAFTLSFHFKQYLLIQRPEKEIFSSSCQEICILHHEIMRLYPVRIEKDIAHHQTQFYREPREIPKLITPEWGVTEPQPEVSGL